MLHCLHSRTSFHIAEALSSHIIAGSRTRGSTWKLQESRQHVIALVTNSCFLTRWGRIKNEQSVWSARLSYSKRRMYFVLLICLTDENSGQGQDQAKTCIGCVVQGQCCKGVQQQAQPDSNTRSLSIHRAVMLPYCCSKNI